MLGPSHVATGAATGLVITPVLSALTGIPLTPWTLLASTAVFAGASVFPDLDTPQGTLSRSLGFVTVLLSTLICTLAGGHRKGTHSILGVVLFGLLCAWSLSFGNMFVTLFWTVMPISMLVRTLMDEKRVITNIAISIPLALFLWAITPNFDWLVYSLIGGYIVHLLGDMLTKQGLPLLWPIGGFVLSFYRSIERLLLGLFGPLRFLLWFLAIPRKMLEFMNDAAFGFIRTDGMVEPWIKRGSLAVSAFIIMTSILWPLAQESHPELQGSAPDKPKITSTKGVPIMPSKDKADDGPFD